MLNTSVKWTVLFYGTLLVALGIVGYQSTHSKISLIMGVISGLLVMGSAGLLFLGKRVGLYTAGVMTLLLTGMFSYRYAVTFKMFPAFMAVLSGAMLLYLLSQSVKYKN